MTENPAASDWATSRGDKWSSQLTGMEAMLSPVDDPLFEALRLAGPAKIAEVGCGGGGTAVEFLRRAPTGSIVHGFDISPTLVERARSRAKSDPGAVTFEVADMATTAPASRYDRLFSRFGIMFFDDPAAAFTNLARWIELGGRFAFAAWGPPADNPWMTSGREAVAKVVDLPKPDPEAPGPFRYADAAKLVALLEGAGLAGIEVQDWRGSLPVGGALAAAAAADFALAAFSFADLLAAAGDDARREAHRDLTARFASREQDGAVRLPARVRIFTGART